MGPLSLSLRQPAALLRCRISGEPRTRADWRELTCSRLHSATCHTRQQAASDPLSRYPKERTMTRFVWLLSHDQVNQELAKGLGVVYGFPVQVRLIKEGVPDGDCRALVVDLDSVAPNRQALRGLVKELAGRPHPYPVAAFGYNLEDDQLVDLRLAGIQVFQHGLGPQVFAAIAE